MEGSLDCVCLRVIKVFMVWSNMVGTLHLDYIMVILSFLKIFNTTGYFRVFGTANFNAAAANITFILSDGATNKTVLDFDSKASINIQTYDFIVFIAAGDSLLVSSNNSGAAFRGNTRQIADISGNLIDP